MSTKSTKTHLILDWMLLNKFLVNFYYPLTTPPLKEKLFIQILILIINLGRITWMVNLKKTYDFWEYTVFEGLTKKELLILSKLVKFMIFDREKPF